MTDLVERRGAIDGVRYDAGLSPCETWRYWLTRTWDDAAPPLVIVGLNPSTADANLDDPTIRRCMAFARREGHGGLVMLNLFAFRATDPKNLKACGSPARAVGPDNTATIWARVYRQRVVCAWGAHGGLWNRDREVLRDLRRLASSVLAFGKTKDGHPKHPLYLRGDTPLEAFA